MTRIAVERPDRAPLAVPIWYGYEPAGEVLVWTDADSLKHKLIRSVRRFSITVQDEQPPYKYVTADGDVASIGPADAAGVRALAVRYLGEEAGGEFTDENLGPSSVVIRMRPQRWLSKAAADSGQLALQSPDNVERGPGGASRSSSGFGSGGTPGGMRWPAAGRAAAPDGRREGGRRR